MNFERFHNFKFGKNLDNVTSLDEITMSALGIEVWALHDMGEMEMPPYTLHRLLPHRCFRHLRRLHPRDAPDRIYDCMVRTLSMGWVIDLAHPNIRDTAARHVG